MSNKITPPQWALNLLRKFAHPDTAEEVEGDLQELYMIWLKEHGLRSARRKYVFTVLTLLRPFKRSKQHQPSLLIWLHSYFKFAIKNLTKNKYYTSINVAGLVFGMLSVLIIAKYVGASTQFDQFHLKKDQLFSLSQRENTNGDPQRERNSTYLGVAELITQLPEAVHYTRYNQQAESLVITQNANGKTVSFTENRIFISDSSFLKLFTFPLLRGNANTALSAQNTIVITESTGKRYFGDADPMGETLTIRTPWGSENSYQVTAVLKDLPAYTNFHFDFLIPETQLDPMELWTLPDYGMFILLKENADPTRAEIKLTSLLENIPLLKSDHKIVTIALTPLANASLSVADSLLVILAIFILFITWINYINQTIAQSYWRIKEVGVKRIMGASRTDLKKQFIIESSLTCFFSLLIILIIYPGIEDNIQLITKNHLLPLWNDPTWINPLMIIVFIIGIFIASSIPSIILLSKNFGASLKSNYSLNTGKVSLRKGLVIFQFSISTILMISVFVISGQLDYLQSKDKGVDMNGVVVIKSPIAKDTTWMAKRKILQLFKDRCGEVPMVQEISSSTTVPGEEYRHETFLSLINSNTKTMVHQNGVDEHFFSVYHAKFVAGHDFIPNAHSKNRESIILNESAAKAFGISDYQEAMNTRIIDLESPEESYELIGIVKDFHQTSIKYEVQPMAFKYNVFWGHCSIKIRTTRLYATEFSEGIKAMKQIWKETYPDASFNYYFIEEKFAAQDSDDQSFGKFFRYFTTLSIVLSCLGLFGLSLLLSMKRQREIGVRKVFGASSINILILFLKEYIFSLAISLAIGAPVAWYLMNQWLTGYAYKIEVGVELILLSAISLIVIFLGTVSYHTIKSSMTNPSTTLKE